MEISLFTKCLFEFIGTLVLVLLGDGVVASTVLKRSKGFHGGWIVITIAWGLAVMCGVLIAGPYSGAHLNPAVSVGLAVAGSFPWQAQSIFPPSTIRKKPLLLPLVRKEMALSVISASVRSPSWRSMA